MSRICTLAIDLKTLPDKAFIKSAGVGRDYYIVKIEIAMIFGSMLEFKLIWDGKVVSNVAASYV